MMNCNHKDLLLADIISSKGWVMVVMKIVWKGWWSFSDLF